MRVKRDKPSEIYQLHIMLLTMNPPIWRRILVRSDSSITDLHFILQIAFDWSDVHLHRSLIRGKEFGIGRSSCTCSSTDAKAVCLADFSFRRNERVLYEYDFGRFMGASDSRGRRATGSIEDRLSRLCSRVPRPPKTVVS